MKRRTLDIVTGRAELKSYEVMLPAAVDLVNHLVGVALCPSGVAACRLSVFVASVIAASFHVGELGTI